MPKRKSGLSSQHSQKSRRIDPSSMVKSSQLTRASLRHRKPSEEPITATVVDVENDNARTPVSPLILDSQANEVTQGLKLPQGCTLDVGAFWDVSAEPFPPVDVKYSPEVTDLYEASAQPTTLPCSHVRDPKPSGGIPQMTCTVCFGNSLYVLLT